MATMATMAMFKAKCPTANLVAPSRTPQLKSISLLSLQNLPKRLAGSNLPPASVSSPLSATGIAGAIFATLSTSDAAFAAQQIADMAEGGDNRGLALLIPVVPAVLWVLYNILQPALNQVNRMRSEKGVVVGLGLGAGGLLAGGLVTPPSASAGDLVMAVAEASSSSSDSRGLLLLFVVAPAIGWVLFNILQPALNQINRMRSD